MGEKSWNVITLSLQYALRKNAKQSHGWLKPYWGGGDKLIIEATTTEWPGQKPHTAYKVFHGLAVEKYARQHTLLQSNAHHLLTQLV